MHTIDLIILIPFVILVIAAFISWRKGKNRGCQSQNCSNCSRNPNICPYVKEKQEDQE